MPVTRRWVALVSAGVLAVGACSEHSRVDPAAAVTVSGSASAADGRPLAGRPVRLGGGVGAGEGTFAVLTLGLACAAGACTGRVFDTTTAADGTYRFGLRGRDTQSTFGEALSQLVTVSAAPLGTQVSGASASARFRVQVDGVRLPALDLVDPGLSVDGAQDVVARWATSRPGPYELSFEQTATVPVWRVPAAQGAATVDPRVLEDSRGRVVVSGGSTDRIEGSDVALRWRSPGVGYVAGAGVPPSRGRPCRVVDAAGGVGAPQPDCPATDGDLTTMKALGSRCPAATTSTSVVATCPRPVAVVVDLGRPVPAGLVVVRGCEGGCAVETSADGVTYRPAGAVADGFGALALPGLPVTSVRVGLGAGGGLREVSVWGPRPAAAALRPAAAAAVGLRRAFGGGGDGGRRAVSRWLVALAAILAGGVLVGAGFVAGRRRPQR